MEDVDYATKKWNTSSMDQLNKGYLLYVSKCGSCHYLHKPAKFPEAKWLEVLPKMGKKAKLNEEEINCISKYIISKCNATNSSGKK